MNTRMPPLAVSLLLLMAAPLPADEAEDRAAKAIEALGATSDSRSSCS
jgi:hypothetical protein